MRLKMPTVLQRTKRKDKSVIMAEGALSDGLSRTDPRNPFHSYPSRVDQALLGPCPG